MSGLLVVTSHPDDEVLIAGGTLALCSAAGIETAVVCLTRGEHGPISEPSLATRAELPAVRIRELQAACSELGVGWVRCYRRQDGNLRWSDAGAIVSQLARILQTRRPESVISFGEDGLYWHPDHIATFDFTRRAVARVGGPVTLYRSVWPPTLMPELVAELRARGLADDLWELAAEDFGGESDEGALVIDVRSVLGRKLRALRCHRTQLGPEHAFAALPDDLAERFLGFERFARVNPGPDATDPVMVDDWLTGVLACAGADA
ncbi:MAG: PIG-L deacetylase family protein [Solirubrobacteraceae bacterium]